MERRLTVGMAELARSMKGDASDDRPQDARVTRVGFSAKLPPMRGQRKSDGARAIHDVPRRGRVATTLMNEAAKRFGTY